MRFLFFCVSLLFACTGCGQQPLWRFIPQTTKQDLALGDTVLSVVQYRYNNQSAPFFLHLHHNEQTADSVLHAYLEQKGGMALGLYNKRQRLVTFTQKGKRFLFDPNRMFTPAGLRKSLQLLSNYQPHAANAISILADTVLHYLPAQAPVIAAHNNTNGAYSILDYTRTGRYAGETAACYRNAQMDPDDFVLTNHRPLFNYLQQQAISVVLQNDDVATDDGSLGYWMGRQKRVYVNIEAEHGHGKEQARLIEAVTTFFESGR